MWIEKKRIKKEDMLRVKFKGYPSAKSLDDIRACPGRLWNAAGKYWIAPLSSLDYLDKTFNQNGSVCYRNLAKELSQIECNRSTHKKMKDSIVSFEYHPRLYSYQKDVIKDALKADDGFLLALDCGTGKTLIALELVKYLKQADIYPALVVCPASLIEAAWVKDNEGFEIGLNMTHVRNGWKTLPDGYDIYVINYEMVKKYFKEIMSFGFKVLVLDESSRVKGNSTKIAKMMLSLSQNVFYTYLLSATPAPNNRKEYFTQLSMIGAVSSPYYAWLNKFFRRGGYRNYEWIFKPSMNEEFLKQFNNKAVFLKKEDCLDLPEKTFIPVSFKMSKEETDAYQETRTAIRSLMPIVVRPYNYSQDDVTEANKMFSTLLSRLRQLSSGFYYNEDTTMEVGESKLQILEDLLEGINGQVIVWTQFTEERNQLLKRLSDKYSIACLTGKETTKEKEANIKAFQSGSTQILVAHPKSAAHGLTFTNCSYAIYYSLSFSLEDFLQSQDRIHRIGQHKACTYYILQAEDTLDQKIYSVLAEKKDVSLGVLQTLLKER